jgi:hypothetical protein
MRRRARHFNPAHAGAASCYDARFLALADNDAVADWTDRSANARTASQATSGNRPVFKTAVQGGSPIVRFDGSNDQLLTSSYALPSAASLVSAAKADAWQQTAQYRPIATQAYTSGNDSNRGLGFCYLAPGGVFDWSQYDALFIGSGYATTSTPKALAPITSGSDFRVISTVLGANTARAWSNGSVISSRKEATGAFLARSDQFVIGGKKGTVAEAWDGDIGCLSYFHVEISDALRKRTEHAAAFSWKISCN